MTGHKELKPPAELVEAVNASGDMTAPGPSSSSAYGPNTPHEIRARIEHETPSHLRPAQHEVCLLRARSVNASRGTQRRAGSPPHVRTHTRASCAQGSAAMGGVPSVQVRTRVALRLGGGGHTPRAPGQALTRGSLSRCCT